MWRKGKQEIKAEVGSNQIVQVTINILEFSGWQILADLIRKIKWAQSDAKHLICWKKDQRNEFFTTFGITVVIQFNLFYML